MHTYTAILLLGVGATAITDLWGIVRAKWLGIPFPDYGMVGRWLLHMPAGRFRHISMASATPKPGELVFGWLAHYVLGIVFAGLLILFAGSHWLAKPTFLPALATGVITVVTPFFVMQPGMGLGIAASKAPDPASARINALITHGVFGVGLYLTGIMM